MSFDNVMLQHMLQLFELFRLNKNNDNINQAPVIIACPFNRDALIDNNIGMLLAKVQNVHKIRLTIFNVPRTAHSHSRMDALINVT